MTKRSCRTLGTVIICGSIYSIFNPNSLLTRTKTCAIDSDESDGQFSGSPAGDDTDSNIWHDS
jgi:hypothetical protein